MNYATIVIEMPASSAAGRQEWQTLRDNILSIHAQTEGVLRLAENCVSLELSSCLALFSEICHHCSTHNLRHHVLITENRQVWISQ